MRWQQKSLTVCALVPSLLVPLGLTGCGSSGRTTTIVETWEERPRFFTADEGEEHSRFTNLVWYERPRFFTKAEGEEQSRFNQMWDDRPRVFTRKAEYTSDYTPSYVTSYPSTSYGTTTYGTTTSAPLRTVPVESQNTIIYDEDKNHHHKNCDCPHHRVKTQKTFYQPTTTNTPSQSPVAPGYTNNSYGAATHRNVTQSPVTTTTTNQSRVTLTSDLGNRSFDGLIANWPQESRTAAMAMQAKYGPPDSSTSDQLIWRDQDPFAEIIVFKSGTPHAFPTQHMDVLAQSIYFNADADDLDELTSFRGNIKVDHARGLMTAKCKDEASNFLALNLAHDILTGQKSVVEANNTLAEKSRGGIKDDDYVQGLMFDVGTDISDDNVKKVNQEVEVEYPEVDTDVDIPNSDE
jgi:hypothetical protein